MSAYMDLNGVPAAGNPSWLMRDVLRQDWGFKGFVVSDWDAIKSLQVTPAKTSISRMQRYTRAEGRDQYGDDEQQLSARELAHCN